MQQRGPKTNTQQFPYVHPAPPDPPPQTRPCLRLFAALGLACFQNKAKSHVPGELNIYNPKLLSVVPLIPRGSPSPLQPAIRYVNCHPSTSLSTSRPIRRLRDGTVPWHIGRLSLPLPPLHHRQRKANHMPPLPPLLLPATLLRLPFFHGDCAIVLPRCCHVRVCGGRKYGVDMDLRDTGCL